MQGVNFGSKHGINVICHAPFATKFQGTASIVNLVNYKFFSVLGKVCVVFA